MELCVHKVEVVVTCTHMVVVVKEMVVAVTCTHKVVEEKSKYNYLQQQKPQ
jgi:hypothetical protein